MKDLYLTMLVVFFALTANAQIGINTDSPLSGSIVHIDPLRNTLGSTNQSDDIVVSPDGYLGVGTINPVSNLSVNGTFRINDGTQKEDYILVSDSDGIGSWQSLSVNKYVIWELSGSNYIGSFGSFPIYDPLLATSTLLRNEINGCSQLEGVLTLPAGRYLFLANGDQNIAEYGTVDVIVNGSTLQSLMSVNSLGGASFVFNLAAPAQIQLNFTYIDIQSLTYNNQIPTTVTYTYTTTIIQLENI
ncbi:hypothetical protein [Dysgonomonas macrotermitis]|uniref:Uncharacterized protein n=1 Tax=Dysgonomonas macrotermitis TaxID=1346286 RepID=A0A1M5K4A7_9BACT|nr:hypothetical protein [Dysgonomonas macrotermitis]SHG47113.1 hypothetical protein SAMN05444362_1345 [Dysgonomonas macrotermitis]